MAHRCRPDAVLTAGDRARIAEAVRAGEARTSAEIVVMVAGGCSGYRSVALAAALVVGLAVPWPLIAFTDLPALRIFLAQLAGTLAALLVSGIPRARFALVPRSLRRSRARESAARAFWTQGVSRTRGRTGVLVYVALAERYAEIVADDAVARVVPEAQWRETVSALLDDLSRDALAEGLVRAVAGVAARLEPRLPAGERDADELPDRVILAP